MKKTKNILLKEKRTPKINSDVNLKDLTKTTLTAVIGLKLVDSLGSIK